ncbi:MAG TPA: hypothetical protein VJC37_09445 [Planctomycetota bacterium]|nr:hypothetical protein [Planctomycetota bacterium]
MKNTEPGFWKYFCAYALICVGTGLIALNIIGRVVFGEKESLLVAFFSIWLGVITLAAAKKSYPGSSPDQAGKK